ncbi:exonuclease SbcCD subunit D [Priestia taiwanensis]|uniref:Nuclease SbcCD subunit D n=1 Tax=Priestia taiwanensis TaxID=1347902 RepID=A0A917AMG6_9BACI|nr:exonuclease SbcCD subunit D [Priestia taiwanensis]MBM7362304.1 exonuclease SbcD [Priestia taiwanensis]GGE61092.1 nuclease SbcCD subunit D [Priestia taiwanensis]
MKIFHTADWHLGKLIHNVYMTNDQQHILDQFITYIKEEKPDVVVIAGDLYDRAIPPIEAVELLDDVLKRIVIDLKTPVIAISGNHDSPQRLDFGSSMMKEQGLYLVGELRNPLTTIKRTDEHGEVHFHLIPYADPGKVRYALQNEDIRTHDDAMKAIVDQLVETMDKDARHVFVGHAFVTPTGEKEENTSESERPLAIGGAEYVNARYFKHFHYTALGHLHQAHFVYQENIRYAGSPMKYSISEEKHKKGFYVVDLQENGEVVLEKRLFTPKRDMRRITGTIEEILQHTPSEDYVFVTLQNDTPVLHPMEKIRSVYPNAMHVERQMMKRELEETEEIIQRHKMDELSLFKAFYKEMKREELSEEKENLFTEVVEEMRKSEV